MARARNIKPGLFKNELLGVADPFLMILFESLWCLADREGRLEDRPLRIKAETFPYRDGMDVNGYLTELERLQFICRYSVNGQPLIQVLNFTKHQTPHKTEKASELPAMEANSLINSVSGAITVNAPLKHDCKTAALPPDSLIPDSLIPDSTSRAIAPDGFALTGGDGEPEEPKIDPHFLRAWERYPKRHGGNSRADALVAWKARLRAGATVDEMIAGVERYAMHLKLEGKIGTPYVMQGATFFGPGERYKEDWPATPSKAVNHAPSRHSGFENIDYNEGIEDGRIT